MTSPVQVALRELMILTKCYCDGEHPRLGHNCSFRPDVVRVVAEVARLQAEIENLQRNSGEEDCACGHPARCSGMGPPWNAAPDVSDGGGGPSGAG